LTGPIVGGKTCAQILRELLPQPLRVNRMPTYWARIRIAFADASVLYSTSYRSLAFDLSMIGWSEDDTHGVFSSMPATTVADLEHGLDIVFKQIAPLGELSRLSCEISRMGS